MTFRYQVLESSSKYLNQVIKLGDQNSKTLGFIPEAAFINNASKGWIIVCLCELDNGETELAAYLMYRTRKDLEARITHFCIAQKYRGRKIAKPLFEKFKEKTRECYGVGLFCRRDYNLDYFWNTLGFSPQSEKTGRGKDKEPLIYWYHDYGKPNLLKLLAEQSVTQKPFIVVLDTNIFLDFYLGESTQGSKESQALKNDWIIEEQELFLTKEIYVDLNRIEDIEERKKWKRRISDFQVLPEDTELYDEAYKILRQYFPEKISENSESDLKHLAYSVAGEAGFFITRDEGISNLASIVRKYFDLEIMHPSEYITHLDELYNKNNYNTERLSGTTIVRERIKSTQKKFLISHFLNNSRGERKSSLRELMNTLMLNPEKNEIQIIFENKSTSQSEESIQPIILFAYTEVNESCVEIPLFRMRKSSISKTLVRHLILEIILRSVSHRQECFIKVTDKYISEDVKNFLLMDSFQESQDNLDRLVFRFVGDITQLKQKIRDLSISSRQVSSKSQDYENSLLFKEDEEVFQDPRLISELERNIYPGKILEGCIPNYIIPIKPEWAKKLFDADLANQELFPVDPMLALKREVVYYCLARNIGGIQNLQGIGRILWYVTSGTHQGIQAIRACSRLDEVIIDTPENLYKRFSRLGVYRKSEIQKIPKVNDPERKVMALKFSDTELFSKIISFDRIKEILNSTASFQTIRPIGDDAFEAIYREGVNS